MVRRRASTPGQQTGFDLAFRLVARGGGRPFVSGMSNGGLQIVGVPYDSLRASRVKFMRACPCPGSRPFLSARLPIASCALAQSRPKSKGIGVRLCLYRAHLCIRVSTGIYFVRFQSL